MKKKRIIISALSDLVSDQRIHRVASSLQLHDYDVVLVGYRLKKSLPLQQRSYATKRFRLFFKKGPLFFATFNLRLFIFLLFCKYDLLLSNDLDTLLPNYMASKLRRKKLVHDAHEYYTGVPELENRRFVRGIWKWIEKKTLPHVKYTYTVNESIKELYRQDYGISMQVIRNVPVLVESKAGTLPINLPEGKKILLLQGAGINTGRGAEELVRAMQYLDDSFFLLFIGSGNNWNDLKKLSQQLNLAHKIRFIERVPLEILYQYTRLAHLGLTLDKANNINYRFSLPNKLFDYIHAGVPVLASDLPEIRKIIDHYLIGTYIENHDPEHISQKIVYIFSHPDLYNSWKKNLPAAAADLCWQKEEKKLLAVFNSLTW